MNILDIVLLLCFIPGIVQGVSKGLVKQIVSFAALFIGFTLAKRWCVSFAAVLAAQMPNSQPVFTNALSFALIFLAAILVISLIGSLITKIINAATLGWANRLLGVVFALLTTAFILGILACLFDGLNTKWQLINNDTLNASEVYVYLRDFGSRIFPFLKSILSTGNA